MSGNRFVLLPEWMPRKLHAHSKQQFGRCEAAILERGHDRGRWPQHTIYPNRQRLSRLLTAARCQELAFIAKYEDAGTPIVGTFEGTVRLNLELTPLR
jgi:hypothetical protein